MTALAVLQHVVCLHTHGQMGPATAFRKGQLEVSLLTSAWITKSKPLGLGEYKLRSKPSQCAAIAIVGGLTHVQATLGQVQRPAQELLSLCIAPGPQRHAAALVREQRVLGAQPAGTVEGCKGIIILYSWSCSQTCPNRAMTYSSTNVAAQSGTTAAAGTHARYTTNAAAWPRHWSLGC
jgi:hypothetical protein